MLTPHDAAREIGVVGIGGAFALREEVAGVEAGFAGREEY